MVGVGTKQIKEGCLLGLMICAILTVKKQKTPLGMRGMKITQCVEIRTRKERKKIGSAQEILSLRRPHRGCS